MRLGPDTPRPRMPPGVWVLGFVSMLMDISSEMIHSLLPLFLVGTLGVSVLAVGVIEGIAESTALITKVFSGVLSDRLGRRKGLALLGYAMGAFSKPVFALATGIGTVVAARFVDRVGKGIRGAPRDALVADLTPREIRGAAFGLRQSLDTVGAFAGPLLASALMLLWADDFRAVFWVAVVPGLLAVMLLALGVREPVHHAGKRVPGPIRRDALSRLGRAYWVVVAVGAVFTLARFSEAFLVLRASELGVPAAGVPLVMVAMNVVYALTAYPFGRLADVMSHRALLAAGLVVLVASDLVLAHAGGWGLLGVGVALWGVHMGMTQGLLAAMVADTAPEDLRGTAYGVFNLASGVAMLAASAVAGALWQSFGSALTFHAGAAFSVAALLVLAVPWLRPSAKPGQDAEAASAPPGDASCTARDGGEDDGGGDDRPVCAHAFVHGRVQGVGFREACVDQARRLGLVGWVRNRFDGSVEVMLQGPPDAVDRLRVWLHRGPPAAAVARVQWARVPAPSEPWSRFERRPSA